MMNKAYNPTVPADKYFRIKAIAQVYGVDLTEVGSIDDLHRIMRCANAEEWNLVEDEIKRLRNWEG